MLSCQSLKVYVASTAGSRHFSRQRLRDTSKDSQQQQQQQEATKKKSRTRVITQYQTSISSSQVTRWKLYSPTKNQINHKLYSYILGSYPFQRTMILHRKSRTILWKTAWTNTLFHCFTIRPLFFSAKSNRLQSRWRLHIYANFTVPKKPKSYLRRSYVPPTRRAGSQFFRLWYSTGNS